MRVSRAARADLREWVALLGREQVPGVPLARSAQALSMGEGAGAVYADASGSSGFAAWTLVGDVMLGLQGWWSEEEAEHLRIESKELLASTFGLVAFAEWLPRDVVSFTDNQLALSAMRSLQAKSPAMSCLVSARSWWLWQQERSETSLRVTTKRNVWADVGSRRELGGWRGMAALAEAAGFRVVRVEVPREWRAMGGDMIRAQSDES